MTERAGRERLRGLGNLAALALLAAASFAVEPLAGSRPAPLTAAARTAGTFWVSNGGDAGPGSLREALFAAAAAADRPRILLASRRIVLSTPLPPLVHPEGLELAARSRSEIASGGDSDTPVLDVAAAATELEGFTVSGARTGVRLRAGEVRLTAVTVSDCLVGLAIAPGVRRATVTEGAFVSNEVGTAVLEPAAAVAIEGNRFRDNGQGVRAVAPAWTAGGAGLSIARNRFGADRYSVVLANVSATVRDNVFEGALEAAVYLAGAGAEVRRNRVEGAAVGIFADAAIGAEIADNDLLRNQRMGLVVRGGEGGTVAGNRLLENGYGIAALLLDAVPATTFRDNRLERQRHDGIYVLGGSPALAGNRVAASGGAGLRLADYVPLSGPRRVPRPLLTANVFDANGEGRVRRGEYRQERPAGASE